MGACVSANAKEEFPSFHSGYKFGAQLGKGSFGSVFLAEDRATCEAYSVKVQKGRVAGADSIIYEASLWQHLDHRYCVGFVGLFQEADVYFAVMELCHCSLWDIWLQLVLCFILWLLVVVGICLPSLSFLPFFIVVIYVYLKEDAVGTGCYVLLLFSCCC
ncbi:unnamed protein product [Polarella glacialis]|uniref:Protein kinase domain-containing protein n=1 Tax=Polarella glacialis TaxID=89957 RepID=A0A813FN90_POLGL|nr:unnamed protein product [Polarella glacialis]